VQATIDAQLARAPGLRCTVVTYMD
jgi:hypothetical protein